MTKLPETVVKLKRFLNKEGGDWAVGSNFHSGLMIVSREIEPDVREWRLVERNPVDRKFRFLDGSFSLRGAAQGALKWKLAEKGVSPREFAETGQPLKGLLTYPCTALEKL